MIDWLILLGYLAGFLWCYRKVYLMLANDEYFGDQEATIDRVMLICVSMICSIFWPVLAGLFIFLLVAN